jgi:hypothetical protein
VGSSCIAYPWRSRFANRAKGTSSHYLPPRVLIKFAQDVHHVLDRYNQIYPIACKYCSSLLQKTVTSTVKYVHSNLAEQQMLIIGRVTPTHTKTKKVRVTDTTETSTITETSVTPVTVTTTADTTTTAVGDTHAKRNAPFGPPQCVSNYPTPILSKACSFLIGPHIPTTTITTTKTARAVFTTSTSIIHKTALTATTTTTDIVSTTTDVEPSGETVCFPGSGSITNNYGFELDDLYFWTPRVSDQGNSYKMDTFPSTNDGGKNSFQFSLIPGRTSVTFVIATLSQQLNFCPSTSYDVSLDIYFDSPALGLSVSVFVYPDGGDRLIPYSGAFSTIQTLDSQDGWYTISGTFTTAADISSGLVQLMISETTSTVTIWVDNFKVVPQDPANVSPPPP